MDDYLRHLRGTESDWRSNKRNPPEWCRRLSPRHDRVAADWLPHILRQIEAFGEQEPLFVWHANEILGWSSEDSARIRSDIEKNLHRLRRMRNAVAHEGDPLLADEETDFLAALGAELLFMAFERPEVIRSEGPTT
jgi:hypothetical protein